METRVKQEVIEQQHKSQPSIPTDVIDLSDSDEDDAVSEEGEGRVSKRQKLSKPKPVLPAGFLDPLPPLPDAPMLVPPACAVEDAAARAEEGSGQACKQFWKAGDYEGAPSGNWDSYTGGMDHVRVHPKFLHSNATSHKWALGAFAELLDNSLDEVCNGATYVNIDMLVNKKDKSRMLLIEDNGGGMDPEKMRQCMSLGYSAKSKLANTIGQYGNGFKTSTMRLGADVIVFSRCSGKKGKSPTQSIGLLSYTFLRSTGKEDIVVPILDYERRGCWNKVVRSSEDDWKRNVDTIVQWSPYSSEVELLQQFHMMKDQGTRVIIYNLWEDDQGQLELDFDSDRHDIQIRGVNRDERNIQMAKDYPNSRHFLTYRHSLRSYVSILYLRLPPNFRIILRGKDVEHHNVVNDMMMTQEVTYRPAAGAEGAPKDENMVAVVTIGFVKDARAHIDIQGFNVYHKNRLIKPFWRLWNAAGSDGRGVIGVLEANFVEPAHDKQGFERTTVLARLENKLIQMQKTYWSTHCHKIGYAPRRNKKHLSSADCESSPDFIPSSSHVKGKATHVGFDKSYSNPSQTRGGKGTVSYSAVNGTLRNGHVSPARARGNSEEPSSPSAEDVTEDYVTNENSRRRENGSRVQSANTSGKAQPQVARRSLDNGCPEAEGGRSSKTRASSPSKDNGVDKNGSTTPVPDLQLLEQLKEENQQLKERLKKREEEILGNLQIDLEKEREKCKSLEAKLEAAEHRIDELNKEQESLIDIFSEERDRRDLEEESLRKKLKDASNRIQELLDKVAVLEKMKYPNGRR